jgi:hypothetical protein
LTNAGFTIVPNIGNVGNVVAVAVAVYVAAVDGPTAAGDGRPTNWQNCCELVCSISRTNKGYELMKRIVGLLFQLLWNMIKEVLNNAALIDAML